LSFGRPGYALVNDSNLDWNQSLPDVKAFADHHGLQTINLDDYGFTDTSVDVPQAQIWDCQTPAAADGGQWVAVSANMIMDGHNCIWLTEYEHQSLAGGSMYAVHLPGHIPEAGSPGGPPLASDRREFAGAPFDIRSFFLNVIRHPDKLPQAMEEIMARFKTMNKPQSSPAKP
jgi:hypothetical protein